MQEVLGEYVGKFCVVYLDDILVFSKSPEQHTEHLRLVLAKLREHKLYAKRSKCKFAIRQVQFLGHVVDAAGVTPDPAKLRVIQDWPVPLNSKQMRQFLDLAQCFGKSMQGFSNQVASLTGLLRKNAKWHWKSTHEAAFQGIKSQLPLMAVTHRS